MAPLISGVTLKRGASAVSAAYFRGVNVAGVDSYMFAAHRQGATSRVVSAAGSVYSCDAVTYYSPPYETKSPRFCFSGFYCDQNTTIEHPIGNDVFFQGVSIEISGVRTPILVGGSSSFTVTNGGYVWTDENAITIPANTTYRIISATNVSAGLYRNAPVRVNPKMSLDGVRQGATDQSSYLTGSGTFLATTGVNCVAPMMIVAKGWKAAGSPPVPLIIGDSIAAGNNDNQYDVPDGGVWGYIARGLNDNVLSTRMPYCNLAVPGVSYSAVASDTFATRKQMMADVGYPFTSIISEMGTNAGGGASAVSGWPAYGSFLKTMGNKPIIQTTMLAKSTANVANIGWTTLGNQSVIDFSAFNTFVRNHADSNIDAHIDMGASMESSLDSGIWAVPSFSTTLAADFTGGTKVLSLNAAPPIRSTLITGMGGTIKNFGVVESVTGSGPYTVNLRNYIAGNTPSGTTIVEANTTDGVHPLTRISETAASVVIAAKNGGVIV